MVSRYIFLLLFITLISEAEAQGLIPYRKGNKWGYANPAAKVVVRPVYDWVSHYGETSYIVSSEGKFGLLDKNGKPVTKVTYEGLQLTFDPGYIIAQKDGKKGIISNKGKIVLPVSYNEVDDNPHKKVIRISDGKTISFFDPATRKTTVYKPEPLRENEPVTEIPMAPMAEENVSSTRTEITYIPLMVDGAQRLLRRTIVFSIKNQVKQVSDFRRDTVQEKFDRVHVLNFFTKSLALVVQNGKWGAVNDLRITVPVLYDSISPVVISNLCKDHYLQVKINGRWGIVSLEGKEMVPPSLEAIDFPNLHGRDYSTCLDLRNGIAVMKNGKWGLIAVTGEELIPFAYDSITYNGMGYYTFKNDAGYGINSEAFKSGIIFTHNDKFEGLAKFHGVMYAKLVDPLHPLRKANDPAFFLGYVAADGTRFYEK